MTDKEKDQTPIESEIVTKESKPAKSRVRGVAASDDDGLVAAAFSPPSKLPFGNYVNRKRVEGYRKVIDAEKGLADALVGHQRSIARLLDIDTEIEGDRLERQVRVAEERNRLTEAQRKTSLAGKETELAGLDLDLKIAQARKKIKQESTDEPEKSLEQIQAEEIEEIRRDARFRIEKIKARAKSSLEQRLETEKDKKKMKDMYIGKNEADYTKEDWKINDIIEAEYRDATGGLRFAPEK